MANGMIADCKDCHNIDTLEERLQKIGDGRIQIRGTCRKCKGWVMWVPYANSYIVKEIVQHAYNLNRKLRYVGQ